MGDWTAMLLPAAVTAAWLFVPGLVCTIGLRLRPGYAAGIAPVVSVGLISSAAVLAGLAGIGWGPLAPIALTALVGGVIWGIRVVRAVLARRGRGREERTAASAEASEADAPEAEPGPTTEPEQTAEPAPSAPRPAPSPGRGRRILRALTGVEGLTFAGMLIGAVLLTRTVMSALGTPDALSQTFDNVFHQSAVRAILDGASASSLDLLSLTAAPGSSTFYPAAWHDTVSLVLMSTGGTDIPLATNAMALVVCALVWPAGGMALCRAVLPAALRRLGLLAAGVLTASLPMVPLLFIVYGVLYPNLLGVALLPAMLVLVLRFLRIGVREGIGLGAVIPLGLIGAIGLSLAHPNASMSLVVLAIPMAIVGAASALLRAAEPRVRGGLVHGLVLAGFATGLFFAARAVWPIIRPPDEALTWEPDSTIPAAIGRALAFDVSALSPAWSLLVIFLVGAYAAVRRGRAEMLGAWIVVVYLWVAITAWPDGQARTDLVGVYYNDPYRLAAVLGIPALPVLALGVAHLARAAADRLGRLLRGRGRRPLWAVLAVAAAVLSLVATHDSDWWRFAVRSAHWPYQISDDSNVLSTDELALIERLPDDVPADAVLIVNAWNGSSLAYSYTGIATTRHHTLEHATPEDYTVEQGLRDAASDPAVCAAVQELGATYVLDFGDDYINGQTWDFPGLQDLSSAPGFTLVDSQGTAALYRIDACAA